MKNCKKATKNKRLLALDIFIKPDTNNFPRLCSDFGSTVECAFPELLLSSGMPAFLVPIHSSEE